MTVIAKNRSLEFPEISFAIKDPASALTHFIGFVAALTAAPFLISRLHETGADVLSYIGCILFLIGLICLYGASTCYHTFRLGEKKDKLLKKFDHLMIFVLIAGTYSPVCLTALRGPIGYTLFAAIWSIAALGMLFKFFWVTCPKWISSVLYIGMGWACIFTGPMLTKALPMKGFAFLLAGGLLYTIGGVIYALKLKGFNQRHPYFGSHEIFHVFVMAGSLCHFITIYKFLF